MNLVENRYLNLLFIFIMMMISSCKDDANLIADREEDADGKITLQVSMYIPALQSVQTRGVLDGVEDKPSGTYLQKLKFYMFVFEDNGNPHANYLRQLAYNNDIVEEPTVTEDDTHTYVDSEGNRVKNHLVSFKVRVDGTAENAILHLVATADDTNFEAQLKDVPDRSEFGIFAGAQGLYTSEHEAYWKRIELHNAINADNKDVIQTELHHLKMIRNYARITMNQEVQNNPYKFVIDGFIIANAVDKGYVAAYNENLGEDGHAGFVDFEDATTGDMRTYRDLHSTEKYLPARHPASERMNPDDNLTWTKAFETAGNEDMSPKYLFERTVQDNNKSFVVIKGHYQSSPNAYRYVKLDIGTIDTNIADAQYQGYGVFETMDVIRNISYDFTITSIGSKTIGHETVEGALGAPPSNNISASVETRPVTEISDGIDRMEVNETTWVIVDDDDGNPKPSYVDMKWRYEANYQTTPPQYISGEVKWNYPGYDISFIGGEDPDGVIDYWDGANATNQKATPVLGQAADYNNNWRGFRLHFRNPDNITRQKTIRLYKPNGLSRDITFILHKRWEFVDSRPDIYSNIEVYPGSYSYENGTMPYESLDEMREKVKPGYVGSQRGAQLTVMFELPEDLPQAIFPLDFTIGFDRQNVENAYVGNAVATWGPSLFSDEGDMPRIQFVKTVTWDYYEQHKIVCARFLTTTELLDETLVTTSSETRVRVKNDYFRLGHDKFTRTISDTDPDATRTIWYWNFSAPEWANDHLGNTFEAGWYNELWHTNGSKGNNQGTYMKIEPRHNADNPEFSFNVNTKSSQAPFTATVTVNGASDNPKNGTSTRYYRRELCVKATIITNDGSTRTITFGEGEENSSFNMLFDGNGTNTDPKDRSCSFPVNAGEILQKIDIWSKMHSRDNGEEATRYYSIKLELTPNN